MSEELEQRFLYTVNPKRVIRNLNENIPMLRISKSLYLTKEEVLKCLEAGSVYRRFSNAGIMERVTKYDMDRVHRDKFISKEDWAKIQEKASNVENLGVNGSETEEKVEEPIKEEKVEAAIEESTSTPVEEEKVEELPVEFDGYVAEVKDEPEELPEVTTTVYPDDGTTCVVDMSENSDSKEEVVFVNDSVEESEDNTESDEDEVVEEENITAVETELKSNSSVVVNYGKKKKHKH